MSQVVYTELEGFPVCWPYGQARPFTSPQKLNTQNITGSGSTTEENVGLIEGSDRYDFNIFGSNEIHKFIKPSKPYRVSKAVVRVKKTGSPPDNLYVRVQDGGWMLQGYGRFGSASSTQYLYGNRIIVQRFQARYSGNRIALTCGDATKTGSPPPIVVELRDSTDGSIRGSVLLASTTIDPSGRFVVTFNVEIQSGRYYSFVLYVQNYGGNASNYYSFMHSNSFLNISSYYSSDGGSNWVTGNFSFVVAIYREPTRYVEASISATSVGTSYSDITVTFSSVLHALDYLVIRVYSPNSNSSNYYSIAVRDYTTSHPDEIGFRGNGQAEFYGMAYSSWFCIATRGIGLELVKIFETNITLTKRIPAAIPQPKIDVTFSGATLLGYAKCENVENYTERSSSGTILNMVMPVGVMLFQLYVCNGSTTVTTINYTEQVYFDKNPVTPRDFNFSELYLIRVDLSAGGQVRFNDHAAGDLYSASATTITFTDFRIPVRKIEVLNGTPTLYFIGVI